MTPSPSRDPREPFEVPTDLAGKELTQEQRADLGDDATQEAYRKAFIAQIRARQCPGCGESDLL